MQCVVSLLSFTPTARPPLAASLRRSHVVLSAADTVTGWQPAVLAKLVERLELTDKTDTYAADLGFDSFTISGAAGTVKSYEAPGKKNVAWCSALSLSDGGDLARASITTFVGPLSDVPHLVASCGVSDGGVDLFIDFRCRAECAYDPSGEYAEPDSREAFVLSGNRKDFAQAFYTEEAEAWRAALLAKGEHTPLSAEDMATQSAGPLYLDLRLPLSEAETAARACEEACERWLGWMESSTENKRDLAAGAKQTGVYARDTKMRANLYGVLLGKYTKAFGDEGKGLTAADAGPLDEAYVGGAS